MKKSAFVIAIIGFLYLALDFHINVGFYGYKLKTSGYENAAINIWKTGAMLGDDESLYQIGMSYWSGDGVKVDLDKAFDLLTKVESMQPSVFKYYEYALADIYVYKGNHTKAKEMFTFSCKNGLEEAGFRLKEF